MRNWYMACAILAALTLCACSVQDMMKPFVPQPEARIGQEFIDDIRAGNFDPVIAAADPQLLAQIGPALPQIRAIFASGPVQSVKVIMANTNKADSNTTFGLGYEYQISNRWFYAEIVMRRMGSALRILGIHVQAMQKSLEEANAFTFSGKGGLHYIFIAAALVVPLFILVTAIAAWRTPIPRWKWLWRIFVLFGFVGLTLNWTSGALNIQALQFVLLGAGFNKAPYGPLLLQVGIPLGAILFWWRRRTWMAEQKAVVQDF